MNEIELYLLPAHESPHWLTYPVELVELVMKGRVDLTPWHLCAAEQARGCYGDLKARLGRDLIPFAYRQDREDLACFEKGQGRNVLIIHDNTSPGWENEGSYPTFIAWLQAAEAEAESGDYDD